MLLKVKSNKTGKTLQIVECNEDKKFVVESICKYQYKNFESEGIKVYETIYDYFPTQIHSFNKLDQVDELVSTGLLNFIN